MKLYVNRQSGYTPLLSRPDTTSPKVNGINLNPNTVVSFLADAGTFAFVEHTTSAAKYQGYVERKYLGTYAETLPRDCVDMSGLQTSDPTDAQQYVMWEGKRQVNFCGQISLAYILNKPLRQILEAWKAGDPSSYKRIMSADMIADGTTPEDLKIIARCNGATLETFTGARYQNYTPDLMAGELRGAIVSVHIDAGNAGRLAGDGVLHWVVLTDAFLDTAGGGSQDLYNPYVNRVQRYSYREVATSARQPYGARLV